MMKYVTLAPRAYDNGEYASADKTCTVVEEEKRPVYTGLLDVRGVKLYRIEERVMGFFEHRTGK